MMPPGFTSVLGVRERPSSRVHVMSGMGIPPVRWHWNRAELPGRMDCRLSGYILTEGGSRPGHEGAKAVSISGIGISGVGIASIGIAGIGIAGIGIAGIGISGIGISGIGIASISILWV